MQCFPYVDMCREVVHILYMYNSRSINSLMLGFKARCYVVGFWMLFLGVCFGVPCFAQSATLLTFVLEITEGCLHPRQHICLFFSAHAFYILHKISTYRHITYMYTYVQVFIDLVDGINFRTSANYIFPISQVLGYWHVSIMVSLVSLHIIVYLQASILMVLVWTSGTASATKKSLGVVGWRSSRTHRKPLLLWRIRHVLNWWVTH